MIVVETIEEVRAVRQRYALETLGLVTTMGYLHQGHLELVRQAKVENDRVAATIFVNPKQFGPTEDLSRYPRDLQRDLELLEAEEVEYVYVPTDETMYPADFQTVVSVTGITKYLEGTRRPTHFDGMTTVVAKLFNIMQPTRAYFGQKDAQQVAVVRQMVQDLNFNLEIVVCPTVREADGLAMSSRNKYLSAEQRRAATALYRALSSAEALWHGGERNSNALRDSMTQVLVAEPLARVDYVSAADPETLREAEGEFSPGKGTLLSMAVFFGKTRLIDNFLLTPTDSNQHT